MSKVCDWYRNDICDISCDGLDSNCEMYSGELIPDKDKEKNNDSNK